MGVDFPCYPIEAFISGGVPQLSHMSLCCLMCYQGWPWQAVDKVFKLDKLINCHIRTHYLWLFGINNSNSLTHAHEVPARFAPLWSPKIPWNPITSACNFHLPSFTSIQWAVIPRNEAFVVSTVQPSAVVKIKPGVAWNVHKVSNPVFEGIEPTYLNISLQLSKPFYKLVMEVIQDVMSCGNVSLGGLWSHANQAVMKHSLVCNS